MNYKLSKFDAPLTTVLFSPIDRLRTQPAWGEAFALVVAAYQYVRSDAFLSSLVILFLSGVVDYAVGVASARSLKEFDPVIAHRGAIGKISGLCLLGLVRLVEHFFSVQGISPNTHGVVATMLAVSLVAVDLQSIAHHREQLGASPIPLLGEAISWIFRTVRSKLPPPPPDEEDGKP